MSRKRDYWYPTHVSATDGSGVVLLHTLTNGDQVVVNECGESWVDPAGSWVPLVEDDPS